MPVPVLHVCDKFGVRGSSLTTVGLRPDPGSTIRKKGTSAEA